MRVALGLGSSLGPRRATFEWVLRKLDAAADVHLRRVSRLYRTPPMPGGAARNWFLNAVALVDSDLEPYALLDRCRSLEERVGRRRALHWADRPLDLDLLLAEGVVRDEPTLQLPHPAIAQRAFVLHPLLEVWPDAIDPRSGQPYAAAGPARLPRAVPIGVLAMRPPVM